jgi:hypothetical protein
VPSSMATILIRNPFCNSLNYPLQARKKAFAEPSRGLFYIRKYLEKAL